MRTLTLLGIAGALLTACAAGTNVGRRDGSADGNTNGNDVAADDANEAGDDVATVDALDATGDTDSGTGLDATQDDGALADAMVDTGRHVNDAAIDVPQPTDAPMGTDAVDVPQDVCVPTTEVCNGLDDDCNGQTDETGCPGHLLITEIVPTPSAAEFIEIYNPTPDPVALDNIYLSDSQLYARVFASNNPAVVPDVDFVARFPPGAVIQPGEYQTLTTSNPSTWGSPYGGACPTYYLQFTATLGTCTAARPMSIVPGVTNSIGATATLTNGGESVTLFTWDAQSDIVADLDYVYYGAPAADGSNPPVDKSMLLVDGPDPDAQPTGYRLDTPGSNQQRAPLPAFSAAAIRCDMTEGTEALNGGNGIWGHNETSENLATTWTTTTPTVTGDAGFATTINASPNAANSCP